MFLIVIEGREEEGAFSVRDEEGDKVLFLFEEEDDATRYALMLEENGFPETSIIEYEDNILIKTCEVTGNKYTVITPNDIVVPPKYNI